MTKADWRKEMRSRLQRMDAADRAARSAAIRARLAADPAWRDARVIGLFAALPGEPDLLPLLAAGPDKTFAFPRVAGEVIVFRRAAATSDLRPGSFGAPEPAADAPALAPGDLDLLVVPGLAFTPHGVRLGRGGGFYDRFLAEPGFRAATTGVCFASQLVDELPLEPHDRRVDRVVTDAPAEGPAR
jgi:5-formyltetrahydrofolate cyclo-ligase